VIHGVFVGVLMVSIVSGPIDSKKTSFRSKERHASAGPAQEAFPSEVFAWYV
jgi:hypothetical protein